MMCRNVLFAFGLVLAATSSMSVADHHKMEVLHEFKHVDYEWSSFPFTKEEATKDGTYNPTKVTITGVKQWKDTLFVTSPRWLAGVPATLNTVTTHNGDSILKPFPSYEDQVIGDQSKLQYAQSMEIDRRGWMWILDVGRINIMDDDKHVYSGAPKLWIWDIEANKLVHEYVFPNEIANHKSSFLNDILVDDVSQIAYISDSSGTGALVVYDYSANRARRWDSHASLSFEDPLPPFEVEQKEINRLGPFAVGGLALAPQVDRIFYTSIHGLKLWSVSAKALRDFASSDEAIQASTMDHGEKSSQCDGLTVSEDGTLYMTMLNSNSIEAFSVRILASNHTDISEAGTEAEDEQLFWPDTFGWATGGLVVSSSRLEMLFLGDWPSTRVNAALFRMPTDARSYQHALGPLDNMREL